MKSVLGIFVALIASAQTYRVQTPSGIVTMNPDDYVAGVIAGESSTFQSDEALQAMSIAARTYAARLRGRHAREGFDFCSTTHCQRYVEASTRTRRITRETSGQFLWYQGRLAFSVYSRSCGGVTENVAAVWPDITAPYLKTHADPYCSGNWNWSGGGEQIQLALKAAGLQAPAHLQRMAVLRRTASGRAQTLSLDGQLVSAAAFRFAVGRVVGWNGIRSDQYNIEQSGPRIVFHGRGEGHGVGLCQQGADRMGMNGRSYRDVLAFYYPGTSLRAGDLAWKQLSGEGVTLFTVTPDSGGYMISRAEAIFRRWRGRLPWSLPSHINIYAYPDVEVFRNATGEPGWIAGRSHGTNIELSAPASSQTLEHEMLHSFVESAALASLPTWFREGLVEHLLDPSRARKRNNSPETDLRQRQNRTAAADAYRAAKAKVDLLVQRYGEATVSGWVTRGLPAEVTYSSASNPAVKSK